MTLEHDKSSNGKATLSAAFRFNLLTFLLFLIQAISVAQAYGAASSRPTEKDSLTLKVNGCHWNKFRTVKTKAFLTSVRRMATYPSIEGDPIENEPHPLEISEAVKKKFYRIQMAGFGKQVLTLKSCRTCEMQSDSNQQVVYINPDFVNRWRREKKKSEGDQLIGFSLAHEISHYIYELGVEQSPERKSLFGYRSLFRGYLSGEGNLTWTNLICGHAEVDFYAAVLLLAMGERKFLDVTINFFERLKSTARLAKDDQNYQHMSVRIQALRLVKANLVTLLQATPNRL